jgi:hypothetical protein
LERVKEPLPAARFSQLVPFLVIAGLVAVFTPRLMSFVLRMGRQIHQPDMASDYFVAVLWAMIVGLGLSRLPLSDRDRPVLLALWAVKVMVALAFMLVYEGHYGLDAFAYFDMAHTPFDWSGLLPGHGNEVMFDITRLHYLAGVNSYHAMKLDAAMVGLAGVYIFYRAAVVFLGHEDLRILVALGLTPSILFWSSILGKDPVVMLGVAIYSYGAVSFWKKPKLSYVAAAAAGIGVASLIRLWMAPMMAVSFGVLLLHSCKSWTVRLLWTIVGAMLLLTLMRPLMAKFKAETAKELIEAVARRGSGLEHGGSAEKLKVTIGGWQDLVRFAPWGAFSALFRPLPGEVKNAFGLMAGLEDLLLLLLVARAMIGLRRCDLNQPVIQSAITLLVLWSVAYGLISPHNMGAAARLRLQVLPVLILVILYLGRSRPGLSLEPPPSSQCAAQPG